MTASTQHAAPLEIRLYPELVEESKTDKYMLQVDHWDLPLGAPVPAKGDRLSLAVNKFQAKPEIYDILNFEVMDRKMFLHNTTDGTLFRIEVYVYLKAICSAMTGAPV